MHAKNNRVNHDFQIVHFLVGSCHTPDGAYALLCDLREDREMALATVKASSLREQAKRIKAQRLAESADEADRLLGQADLAEIDAFSELNARNVAAAEAELSTIVKCIELIQPLRKFSHLSDEDAHEAAQCEEWKLELIHRAENQMLTAGSVSPADFAVMRQHPAFNTEIFPAILHIQHVLKNPNDAKQYLQDKASVITTQLLSIGVNHVDSGERPSETV